MNNKFIYPVFIKSDIIQKNPSSTGPIVIKLAHVAVAEAIRLIMQQ